MRPNGDKRYRDLPVSEKMLPGEDWKGAVQRAVAEELGSVLDGPPIIEIRRNSHKYVFCSSAPLVCGKWLRKLCNVL